MAITVGNISSKSGLFSDGTSYTHSHNNDGDFLLVGLARGYTGYAEEPNAVTYGGQSMTRIDTHTAASYARGLSVWKLVNPPTGANNVEITFTTDPVEWYGVLMVMSASGVDQVTPHGAVVETSGGIGVTTVTGTATSSATGLVVDFVTAGDGDAVSTATVGAGQTERVNAESASNSGGNFGLCSTQPGDTSVTMSWTLDGVYAWKQTIVPLNAAAGGGPALLLMGQQWT